MIKIKLKCLHKLHFLCGIHSLLFMRMGLLGIKFNTEYILLDNLLMFLVFPWDEPLP